MTQPILENIPGVLMFEGHDLTPRLALEAAERHLAETLGTWPAYEAVRGATAAQAWWGGDAVGFVQEYHDGARPVTVVNLPASPGV